MDKAVLEQRFFELAVSSLSAAGGLIHEPSSYGSLRVLSIIKDLVEILDEQGLSSSRLGEIKTRIAELSEKGSLSDEERKEFLDDMVVHCLDLLD